MRVNIYAEELDPNAVEIIEKTTADGVFTGVRIWLYLPATLPDGTQHRGPFIHRPGDDDSSAVTFWGKRDLEPLLEKALTELRKHREDAFNKTYDANARRRGQYEEPK